MHPVIQLTVAVAMVVIAARMWPPILYWLVGFFLILAAIKGARRSIRWLRKVIPSGGIISLVRVLLGFAALIAIAAVADYMFPGKISAVVLLLCFAGAIAVTGIIIGAVELLVSRYR